MASGTMRNENTDWILSEAVNGNKVYYKKKNGIVFVKRGEVGTVTANILTTIANLPSGFQSDSNFQVPWGDGFLDIIGGTIKVKTSNADWYPSFMISFPVKP